MNKSATSKETRKYLLAREAIMTFVAFDLSKNADKRA
jgi:hypothetical protein